MFSIKDRVIRGEELVVLLLMFSKIVMASMKMANMWYFVLRNVMVLFVIFIVIWLMCFVLIFCFDI